MKKVFILSLSLVAGLAAKAKTESLDVQVDSIRMEQLNDVVINGVRALSNEASAVTEIDRDNMQNFSKTGREMPFLLSGTPGITAWSENGTGVGTTYMRIRGAAGSRINVTLDGVPLNSPEDQCVFWVNMNSYAAFLGSAQIQRGLGSSTNGDGAFGGTIALSSDTPSSDPDLEVTTSYGSFNTRHIGGRFSTGILFDQLIVDGAYNQTLTDGFMHGTKGNSGSHYAGLLWMPSDNFMLRYRNIGNFENTGQAWSGTTAGDNDMSLMDGTYGGNTGIKTYQDMYDRGLGQFNSLYESIQYDENGNFKLNDEGKYVTGRYMMKDGTFWDRTTDNFWQNHNILSLSWSINDKLTTSLTGHYTYGYGYYDEFRPNNKVSKFGLSNAKNAKDKPIWQTQDGTYSVKETDFVRKKGLEQHTFGAIWNTNYTGGALNLRSGVSFQQFMGNHFGHLTYVADSVLEAAIMQNGKYTYYDSDASKTDLSAYVKAVYSITPSLSVSADVQFRHVKYTTDGYNDKFIEASDGSGRYDKHYLDINEKYNFFNPKFGLNWQKNGHRAYAMAAYGSREPERNNFTDNGHRDYPKAEQLMDYELGYTYNGSIWRVGVNGYFMDYKDQFVQTGEVSDIGENLTTNIKNSYRLGVELQAGVDPTSWLTIEGNAALSQNKIKDFDEKVQVDWGDYTTIHYDNSTLAFSPSTILNGFVNVHYKGWQAVWHTNFVSRQFLDNTECKDRSLPAYSVSNASVSYSWKPKKVLKEAIFGLNLNNVFNHRYAASGWVYSAILTDGHPNENRYYQIGFIPMSGFTMMGNVTLRF